MVFKILPSSASFHGVDYNEKKQKTGAAQRVYFENFGYLHEQNEVSRQQFKDYLQKYSQRNQRIEKPQFHAILSCKGYENSFDELKQLSLKIMHDLGYKESPTLIYEHRDTQNNHVHIVASRIGANGKKISDHHEARRAQNILNQLLKIKPNELYEKDLNRYLGYSFSSTNQFILLMERAGYKISEQPDKYSFHKYGECQGNIDKETVTNKIQSLHRNKNSISKIRALIYKYKQQYNPSILLKDKQVYSTVPKVFHSDLTNFLQKTFGLEFVFFSAKDHDKPYGYSIIDHANSVVYKGSEIMKLEELLQEATSKNEISNDTIADKIEPNNNAISSEEPLETIAEGESFWDSVIDNGLKDNEDYSRKNSGKKLTRKNKR